MTERWWHRLFGLGEEEEREKEREGFYEPQTDNQERRSVGRFEDTHRHVEVKMTSWYPDGYKGSLEGGDRNSLRREADVRETLDKNKSGGPAPAGMVRQEDRAMKKGKAPFRLTKVPSPVFGFKKPPADFYRKRFDEDFYLDSLKEEQEKKQIAEKRQSEAMHQHAPMPARSDQPLIDRKVFEEPALRRRADTSGAAQDNPNGGTGDHKKTGHPSASDRAPFLSGRGKLHQADRENGGTGDPSASSYLNETVEPATRVSQQPPASPAESASSTFLPQQSADEPERIMPVSSTLPRSPHRPHHPSKVPFNVLMFQSDQNNGRVPGKKESRSGGRTETRRNRAAGPGLQLPLDLLDDPPEIEEDSNNWIAEKEKILAETLSNFHVDADILGHVRGPSVTRFDIHLHPGVKINKVLGLSEDIKLSLAVKQIRIAPVPGRSAVGIEIPNDSWKPVLLKQILNSEAFLKSEAPLTAALGQDVSGNRIVTDLAKMPHGLIAGATGSGKSVCIHSLILSMIYKTSPDDLRFLLIDPKVVELAPYQKIPHLAAPVITEPKEAALALKWAVEEMEKRYRLFAKIGVRDIAGYNNKRSDEGNQSDKLPYIVIVIDELADLMMVSPQDVEEAVCRIAQKARAAGIHLLLATQRPSVDVITGLIKSNIPSRIAFSVASQADSRTILDHGGAERLLGRGDMLFAENGARTLRRLQGCYVSDEEINRVTEAFKDRPAAGYLFDADSFRSEVSESSASEDDLFNDAAVFVVEQGQASVSSIQRHFRIGYNRAARLVDELESCNVVSGANGSKPRQVLMTKENFEEQMSGDKMY